MTTDAQKVLLSQAKEIDIEELVVDHLRLHGYIVLQTGKYFSKPETASDSALSDLVIHRKGYWPKGLNCCIEMKRPGKEASNRLDPKTGYSQAYLEEIGATVVRHSLEEVLDALIEFESSWRKTDGT